VEGRVGVGGHRHRYQTVTAGDRWAGLVADDDGEVSAVPTAIEADPALTPRQRRVLLDVYESFVATGPAPRPRKRRPRRADGTAVES
jgi:hypothetical protein